MRADDAMQDRYQRGMLYCVRQIKGSMKENPDISSYVRCIFVGSTEVGFFSALVTHEEVEIWAEAEEVEEVTQDLDDWETAERKAARKAKIVAVPLGQLLKAVGAAFLVMF